MYEPSEILAAPDSFSFPFTPYKIQQDFMRFLFQVIQNKEIGIFESPTGTGKSLSLTCGAFTWLKEHEILLRKELSAKIAQLQFNANDPAIGKTGDWITEEYEKLQKKESLNSLKQIADKIAKHERKIKEIKRQYEEGRKERQKYLHTKKVTALDKVELLEPISSTGSDEDEFDLKEQEEEDFVDHEAEEKEKFRDVKIYFSSRTHSQLSQVVNEIKNTSFGADMRVVSLASRQVLCINPEVNRIKSSALLNEKCLELQKSKSKVTAKCADKTATKKQKISTKCPFMNQANLERLKNHTLSEVLDIEDLVDVAKRQQKGCAYYSSRLAVVDAQVVMVPYQILLHKKTREQFGIDLRNSIIIIDEAHNLLDTISSIHSAELTLEHLQASKDQLQRYKKKYLARFAAKNVLKLNQLIFVVTRLLKMCNESSEKSRMLFSHELITEGEFFNIDLEAILKFCDLTCLPDKVHGFSQKYGAEEPTVKLKTECSMKSFLKKMESQQQGKGTVQAAAAEVVEEKTKAEPPTTNAIRPLITFLKCLIENFDDGRILISQKTSMKYLLLNPGARFDDILAECRSLILAGGTMKPTDELTGQLFPTCADRVKIYSFDHIVSKDAILPIVLSKGPSGKPFLFNYANRANTAVQQELASTLVNVCNVVPAGVVCFFSSYDYLDMFYKSIEASGQLKRLELRKVVFKETRNSNQADNILTEYAKRIKELKEKAAITTSQNGAILFSVVGGKLSEGMNFSDDLGRCVIVVGLPFPNKTSPELCEKMKYLNRNLHASAGNEYYENLCMKAVNQCIGRAVRHINDYASVLLIDSRYSSQNIHQKLAKWIGENIQKPENYGQVQGLLAKFFRSKKL